MCKCVSTQRETFLLKFYFGLLLHTEDSLGGVMFANKTFTNKTFANGESPAGILAKVRWSFANWRNSRKCIGESTVHFRQLAKFQGMCWRKYSGLSPIGESYVDFLSCHGTILTYSRRHEYCFFIIRERFHFFICSNCNTSKQLLSVFLLSI